MNDGGSDKVDGILNEERWIDVRNIKWNGLDLRVEGGC